MHIVRIVAGLHQRHLHVHVRIVAVHSKLPRLVLFRGPRPSHALGQPPVIADAHQLFSVSLVNEDVAGRHTGLFNAIDDEMQDRGIRAELATADGTLLNADNVARLYEYSPRLRPTGS